MTDSAGDEGLQDSESESSELLAMGRSEREVDGSRSPVGLSRGASTGSTVLNPRLRWRSTGRLKERLSVGRCKFLPSARAPRSGE